MRSSKSARDLVRSHPREAKPQHSKRSKNVRTADFWRRLEDYNSLPAPDRAARLKELEIVADGELLGVLTKSHFVIPDKTRFECQRCGECCRYARKVATFTYEPCPFLSQENLCQKHDSHYGVCRWFPFYVCHDDRHGDLLTIKPYCTGYGRGTPVNYEDIVRRTNELERHVQVEGDGAFIIHEVVMLPDKGEWFFPSRNNVDHLLRLLANKPEARVPLREGKKDSREALDCSPSGIDNELRHAQCYTSGLLGSNRDAQITVNEQGFITDANEPFCQLCQRSRTTLIQLKLEVLFVNSAGLAQDIRHGFAMGKIMAIPHRVAMPDGETVSLLLNAMTYRDRSDGLVHGLLVSAQPVSPSVLNNMLQSQSYARGLLEASLDLLVFLDVDGMVLDVNETTVQMTGRSRARLVGSDFRNHFSLPSEASRGIALTLERGQVRNFELELVTTEGRCVPVQFNATVYVNPDGSRQGIFAAARDVRQLKDVIAELQAAQDYSRGLIERGLDLMVTVSPDGTITDVNTAAIELTETSRERLVGAPFVSFFDEPERARAGIARCFLEGQVRNYELRICRPCGVAIPVSFNASVYRNRSGQVQGVFGIARDIRERLKMMRESEDARSYARSLLESCPDLMVAIDRDGCITDVNEAAVGLTGRQRSELVSSQFESHFVDPARAREGVRIAFATGVVRKYGLDLRGKSGQLIAVSFNASQYMNAQHQVAGVIAIARTLE